MQIPDEAIACAESAAAYLRLLRDIRFVLERPRADGTLERTLKVLRTVEQHFAELAKQGLREALESLRAPYDPGHTAGHTSKE